MSTSILSLPPELLERIFSYLSTDHEAIATTRLVSKDLKEYGSPHLVPRIVLAHRLDAITRFRGILGHPYFHKHVVELVYDANLFQRLYAEDFENYGGSFRHQSREPTSIEWWATGQEHIKMLAAIRCDFEYHPDDFMAYSNTDGSSDEHSAADESEESTLSNGLGSQNEMESLSGSHSPRHAETPESLRSPEHDITVSELNIAFGYDDANMYQGYPDYRRCFRFQERLLLEKLHQRLLRLAFTKLPQLKRVVFTDWRGLAKDGESYNESAKRLFGNMLAPDPIDVLNDGAPNMFPALLQAVQDSNVTRIESLVLGPHLFEDSASWHSWHSRETGPRNPQFVNLAYANLDDWQRMESVVSHLTQLRLAFASDPELEGPGGTEPVKHLRDTLRAGSNLQHLSLSVFESPQQGYRFFANWPTAFEVLFEDVHLPRLKHLDLRRWVIYTQHLQSLLERHKATLRTLHLLDCIIVGDVPALAKWVATDLRLEGIELDGEYYLDAPDPALWRGFGSRWGRYAHLLALGERRWLAGRENRIDRELKSEILEKDDGTWWWRKPMWY